MCTVKLIKSFVVVVSLLSILAACGGVSDEVVSVTSGDSDSAAVLSGQVADGYLSGARVFLDRNGNRMLDSGEPWSMSGAQGHYALAIQDGEGDLYPLVAEVIAGQTVDEDQAEQYVPESYRLEAPAGKGSFISPLTTLVKIEMDKKPALSIEEAESQVRAQLGLSSSISLFKDYVSDSTLDYAHRAARIIAGLMGILQTEIERNVGDVTAEDQRAAIALMISDQVINNCDAIAQALVSAADAAALEEILTTILMEIDTFTLDAELLERYVARMQDTTSTVWDMTAPKIISQRPAIAGSASIDVVVSLTLDEAIDPELFIAATVLVSGPAGPVPGVVSYDANLKQLNFVPENYLLAFSSYQVNLAGITDIYGNPLIQTQQWNFMTIFDQVPPELPEF